jgi:hypothetical protein
LPKLREGERTIKKHIAAASIFLSISYAAFGQDAPYRFDTGRAVPLSLVFYNIGENALHSFAYNYGANWIASGVGTWAFIETGIDWQWRNSAYDNDCLSASGLPFTYIDWGVPFTRRLF